VPLTDTQTGRPQRRPETPRPHLEVQKLWSMWERANYPCLDKYAQTLQHLRNTIGPTGLYNLRNKDLT
jgi:hypothetical protein